MITDDELQKLHQTLDEILDYAASVCAQHGLTYVLLYGTALGAYRHHGIIPWDDDLDIGMPRDDYEKFLRICRKPPIRATRCKREKTNRIIFSVLLRSEKMVRYS